MYLLHIRNFRVLSGLVIISIFRTLFTPNNSFTVVTKHKTIPSDNPLRIPSGIRVGIGILLSRPYISQMISAYNSKRTMSTSSKPVPVKVYLNPDKEKESIVNDNKGRTGIYR